MAKFRTVLSILFCLGLSVLLSGCKAALLDPAGIIAASEKHILINSVLLMLLVVVPVIVLTVAFAWHYRSSNTKAKYEPEWAHSTLLEIIWWGVPIVIIIILAAITWISSHKLDPYRPLTGKGKPLVIQVVALNWKWLFIYPQQHIATVNFLELPVNTPVRFLITADAPMNSFDIPRLAGQIYAMSGMQTKLNILATKEGDYRGLSTNYSGEGFADMYFTAHVGTMDEFNQWVSATQKSKQKLTMDAYNQLAQPSKKVAPEFYSGVTDGLFHSVIMKYMMPAQDQTSVTQSLQNKPKQDYKSKRDYNTRWNKGQVPPVSE